MKTIQNYRTAYAFIKLLPLLLALLSTTGCTSMGISTPLLGSEPKDEYVVSNTPPQVAMNQPVCDGCAVDHIVEYVDVSVPECVENIALITHQPVCQVCDGFSVSVRSRSGPGSCGQQE